MPNGNPNFNLAVEEAYFGPISDAIQQFATSRNLFIDKYHHESRSWNLCFSHPKGGIASLNVAHNTEDAVSVSSVWHVDDYDSFTRSLHWRTRREVLRLPSAVREALEEEFQQILRVEFGDWNQVAEGYRDIWGRYSKREFEAMGPHYPEPLVDP